MEESEQERVNDVDPLIGTWNYVISDPYTGNDFFKTTFNDDGTFVEEFAGGNDGGIWENKGDNFNDEVQTYIIEYYGLATGEADIENGAEIIGTFEDNFNIVSLRNEEDDITILLSRAE